MRRLFATSADISEPLHGPGVVALSAALAPRAVERLGRLRGDLRLGLPAILTDGGGATLVAWIEHLTKERFAAISALGATGIVLTRHRIAALTAASLPAGDVLRMGLPEDADLAWLQTMAGMGQQMIPGGQVEATAVTGSLTERAATLLASASQALPAALVVSLPDGGRAAERLGLSTMAAEDVIVALGDAHCHSCVGSARVPLDITAAGRVHVFRPGDGGIEHSAIEIGSPDMSQPVTVRLHSACFTGDVLGSVKCDCGPQLRAAMSAMAIGDGGILLYLNQEGRGIGLANKMRAYAQQDEGLDTVEANNWLGFEDDLRDFRTGASLLRQLGITRVRLMTNNPAKMRILSEQGIDVVERIPLQVGRTEENARYLATKAAKSDHLLT